MLFFQHIEGYETIQEMDLEDHAFKMLELDDYMFADYQRGEKKINLYIGYYYTASKASAAHSPLICYPSQGWQIESKPVAQSLSVGPLLIKYKEITTSFNQDKELVLYWFQSHFDTNTHSTLNKVDIALNKLTKNDEQHAFVRVAVPFDKSTYEETKKTATDFIKAFYPQFLEFIAGEGQPPPFRKG